MSKQQQPNGTPGKKPPAPSVTRRPVRSFSTWWKFSKVGSLDGPTMLRQAAAPRRFRYGVAGDRTPLDR